MGDKREEKPSTSTAAAAGAAAGNSSARKTWKFEGKLVSSKITPTLAESYKFYWATTLKETPGEKYIRSKRYVIDAGNEYESHWRIELDPNFTDADGTRYLSAYLVLEKMVKPNAVISTFYNFGLNANYNKSGGMSKFSAEKPSFGFPKFISFVQLGKFASPSNTEKLHFVVELKILKEDPNQSPVFPSLEQSVDSSEQMGEAEQGVVIEEMDEPQQDFDSIVLPFNPDEKPNLDSYLRFGETWHPVDTSRVNYFTKFFEPYYVPVMTDLKNAVDKADMKDIFGNVNKFMKLMEFCHTGNLQHPEKFQGLVNILEMAALIEVDLLKQMCGEEVLSRMDISNFVQIVELAVANTLNPSVANPVIWKFMSENVNALRQCTKFNETYQKHKSYYEALMVQDDPSMDMDDDQDIQQDDQDEDLIDLYTI